MTLVLTSPTAIANMDGTEYLSWSVATDFAYFAGRRLDASRRAVQLRAHVAPAGSPRLA